MGLKPKKYTYLVNDHNIGTETFRKTNYIIKLVVKDHVIYEKN